MSRCFLQCLVSGTDLCIYVLKEIVDRFKCLNGSTLMCFLDASKAFDRVTHSILFRKLVERGVRGYIVRILMYWYSNQCMYVRWAGVLSPGFHVSNGVRQGGILSPYLFNVYMDDLSIALNGCHTGYVVDNIPVNHLLYADDLVVFAPSISGLRELLKVCDVFADSHDIKYNPNKSQVQSCTQSA